MKADRAYAEGQHDLMRDTQFAGDLRHKLHLLDDLDRMGNRPQPPFDETRAQLREVLRAKR